MLLKSTLQRQWSYNAGIRSWEALILPRHSVIFDKKCVIFDKRVKKVIYLLNNFNFGTLKVMKTCLVIRFFWEILPRLGFALATHPHLLLLGSRPPPPPHSSSFYMNVGQKYMYLQTQHASIATWLQTIVPQFCII